MKVVAFNTSARKDGNTATLLRRVLSELEAAGVQTELIQLAGGQLAGCIGCYRCRETKDMTCIRKNDAVNACIAKMVAADGILLGSPVYFADVSATMKALIERAGTVTRANGSPIKRKVGAAVVAVRRGGAIHAFDSINHFFLYGQMIVIGSSYWNMGIGRVAGEVENDAEGIETMENLGRNMAWALEKLSD